MPKKDYYQILEISKSASAEEIKSAYRRLAKKYHPDLNPGNQKSAALFIELDNAYDTLNNLSLKKTYDRNSSNTKPPPKKKRRTRKSTRKKSPFDEEIRAHNARRKNKRHYSSEREEKEQREGKENSSHLGGESAPGHTPPG